MSSFDDDPRLTAYALGELPEEERGEIEALLAADPELAAEVAAIRKMADQLTAELVSEPSPADTMPPLDYAALEQAAAEALAQPDGNEPKTTVAPRSTKRRRWSMVAVVATAASLLLGVGSIVWWQEQNAPKEIAVAESDDLLNEALFQVARGPRSPDSVIGPHSLLDDLYESMAPGRYGDGMVLQGQVETDAKARTNRYRSVLEGESAEKASTYYVVPTAPANTGAAEWEQGGKLNSPVQYEMRNGAFGTISSDRGTLVGSSGAGTQNLAGTGDSETVGMLAPGVFTGGLNVPFNEETFFTREANTYTGASVIAGGKVIAPSSGPDSSDYDATDHQNSIGDALQITQYSSVPFNDSVPVMYPDLQDWQRLTELRSSISGGGESLDGIPDRPTTELGFSTVSTTVAVPNSGTVVLGGVRRVQDGDGTAAGRPVIVNGGTLGTNGANVSGGATFDAEGLPGLAGQSGQSPTPAGQWDRLDMASDSVIVGDRMVTDLAGDQAGLPPAANGVLPFGTSFGGFGRANATDEQEPAVAAQLAKPLATILATDLDQERVVPAEAAAVEAKLADARERIRRDIEQEMQPEVREQEEESNTEAYDAVQDNPFLAVGHNPLSTFSIDVDTASYSNVRRMLVGGELPPRGAVRIEEMLNYFAYDYEPPTEGDAPFAAHLEVAACPWNAQHRLVRVGLKGKVVAPEERPACNLVFLIDVSGSMEPENKLPLLKQSLGLLVDRLEERDRVAMVVYAGNSGLVLPSTTGNNRETIRYALERLEAGGSTNGASGIQQAYDVAADHFLKDGVNRVILCTDGDFNVGITDQSQLVDLIEGRAKDGVFLSVLGFGMGNYKDSTLEKLADKGNGNYAYIDTPQEARKVLVDQLEGTLVTIAKDVKIQVEFNPVEVLAYRLIGYENRMLRAEDFNDDTKDAGEIGAGHTVTALYEIVPTPRAPQPAKEKGKKKGKAKDADQTDEQPAEEEIDLPEIDPLRYQQPARLTEEAAAGELLTLKLRYKQPDGQKSKLLEFPVRDEGRKLGEASDDFRFAASVAGFGMLLRESPYRGNLTMAAVDEMAQAGIGDDPFGYRQEFVELIAKARRLRGE